MLIENKVAKVKVQGSEFTLTWLELIFMALENPPEKEGFKSLNLMRNRMDIQTKIEPGLKIAPNFEFTAKEIGIIKPAVEELPFKFNSLDLIEFKEYFTNI